MWYLNRGEKGYDMNVEEAWSLGITGKGKRNKPLKNRTNCFKAI